MVNYIVIALQGDRQLLDLLCYPFTRRANESLCGIPETNTIFISAIFQWKKTSRCLWKDRSLKSFLRDPLIFKISENIICYVNLVECEFGYVLLFCSQCPDHTWEHSRCSINIHISVTLPPVSFHVFLSHGPGSKSFYVLVMDSFLPGSILTENASV